MRELTKAQLALLAMMRQGATVIGNAPPRPKWRIEPEHFNREWLELSGAPMRNHTPAGLQRRGLVRRTVRGDQVIYELTEEGARGTVD